LHDYFLFIDTETSSLPKNWRAHYSKENNWPHILQIAWIIFDSNYAEVKRENHYIENNGFSIDKAAQKIHNITTEFLKINGEPIERVMQLFCDDMIQFNPLVIGHFIELDFHMVNVELNRLGMESIFETSTFYCTMKTSADYVTNSIISHLKLDKFYTILFNEEPEESHNALTDASNTSKIFFHLLQDKKISLTSIYNQEHTFIKVSDGLEISPFKRILRLLFPWTIS
jgi:DNA polymerase-3 subunit epsilon